MTHSLIAMALASLAVTACGGASQSEAPSNSPRQSESPQDVVAEEASPAESTSTPSEQPASSDASGVVPTAADIAAWGYAGLSEVGAVECPIDGCGTTVAPGVNEIPFPDTTGVFTSSEGTTVTPEECAPLRFFQSPLVTDPVTKATVGFFATTQAYDADKTVGVRIEVYEWPTADEANSVVQGALGVPDSCGSVTYLDPALGIELTDSTWLDGSPYRVDDAMTWAHVGEQVDDSLYLQGVAIGQVNNKTYVVTVRDTMDVTGDNYQTKGDELLTALDSAVDWFRLSLGKT